MKLPSPFTNDSRHLQVIIETPKGSRNKYVYDFDTGFFSLKKSLPAGMVFPFDFGFIPATHAQDGDPMDVLVLTDAPTFSGCMVECKVLGVIKVEQEKKGKMVRNDRIVAVHTRSRNFQEADNFEDLEGGLIKEITNFFASYNQLTDDVFNSLGNGSPQEAIELIKESIKTANSAA